MQIQYEIRKQSFSCFAAKNIQFPLHIHRQCELAYVMKGQPRILSQGRERLLREGEIAIFFPDTSHSYQSENEENEILLLIFDPSFVPDFARALTEQTPTRNYLESADVHRDIPHLLQSLLSDTAADLIRQRASLSIILSHLFEKVPLLTHRETPVPQDTLHRLLSYLYNHFLEDISLSETADTLGISKYHLSHIFSEKIGSGFIPYLHSLRIDYACELLQTSNHSITQIAYESGFESPATFHRAFRKLKNTSPLQYRVSLIRK